jgi:sugar O-acyltransferase (sialic acid O-acetyltransferase NeuD family)
MTKPVIVIGVGGYSANLVDMMRDENKAAGREIWRPIGFLDDEPSRRGGNYYGLPVLGPLHEAGRYSDAFFINAIGSTKSATLKPHLIARTAVPAERFITLRHPSAYVSDSAKLGPGSVITQHCVVMADAVVGMHVKTLPLATISYGATIGDYSTIAGGAVVAAEVRIGRCVYVGANCAIRERITIGDDVILGMGAMVVRNIPRGTVAVGIPARPVKPGRQH